ncbi:hypothetical protein LX36DRAFT_58943 [Colletotrichum falcatum]|nr:hypothetical protein LX36DRAFT_58943 [Colletotrichum falcatum]
MTFSLGHDTSNPRFMIGISRFGTQAPRRRTLSCPSLPMRSRHWPSHVSSRNSRSISDHFSGRAIRWFPPPSPPGRPASIEMILEACTRWMHSAAYSVLNYDPPVESKGCVCKRGKRRRKSHGDLETKRSETRLQTLSGSMPTPSDPLRTMGSGQLNNVRPGQLLPHLGWRPTLAYNSVPR